MDQTEQRAQCADKLESAQEHVSQLQVFLGMDGFVDEILHVVDKRNSATSYTRLRSIADFSERVAQAAGKSTNLETVRQVVKLGGNGPIMANAMASLGFNVTYLGCLGYPNLHPVFEEFARRAEVHSIAEPGLTDALEFEDGKIMVGKHTALMEVNWAKTKARYGLDKLRTSMDQADLVGFLNWTMLPYASEIWEAWQTEVCPHLSEKRRLLFLDLADPEKRNSEDIAHALALTSQFGRHFDVILGLNEKESGEIAEVLSLEAEDKSPDGLERLAGEIRSAVAVETVVIHPVATAHSADASGGASAQGPFTPNPLITTGAGDHFNAGFCLGRLLDCSHADSLLLGVASSGFYVRHGASPTTDDLVSMLRNWPGEDATPKQT